MKKFIIISFLSALIVAAPSMADDTPSGVAADVGAVQKDNSALGKTNADLAKDRAAKAQDKATGNWGGQAVDSTKIGADKVKRSVQGTEKSSDKRTLNSDMDSATTK